MRENKSMLIYVIIIIGFALVFTNIYNTLTISKINRETYIDRNILFCNKVLYKDVIDDSETAMMIGKSILRKYFPEEFSEERFL